MLHHPAAYDISGTYRWGSILFGRAVLRAGQHVHLLLIRRYEDTMRESADSSTRHQRYHVLTAATFSNGDNRNFVHMKVVVDAGYHLHSRFAKTVCGGGFSQLVQGKCPQLKMRIPSKSSMNGDRERHGSSALAPSQGEVSVPQRPDQHTASHPDVYDAAYKVRYEHFSRTADHVLPTDG